MLGFVLEEPPLAFSYMSTSIQLEHATKNDLQMKDKDFEERLIYITSYT